MDPVFMIVPHIPHELAATNAPRSVGYMVQQFTPTTSHRAFRSAMLQKASGCLCAWASRPCSKEYDDVGVTF